jgi:hypothetical protein
MSGSADRQDATPAREPAHEARIERIADMMRSAEWERGKSGKRLAAELGLHEATIRADAAIASRRVYAELMQDREAVGAHVGASLTIALEGAIQERDWKAVASLSKVYADASGVSAPSQQVVTVGAIDPSVAARLVRETFGEHAAKRDSDETSRGTDEVPEGPAGS